MWNLLLSTTLAFSIVQNAPGQEFTTLKFYQTDYRVAFERMELVKYNSHYWQQAAVTTFKNNRTCTAVNATFTFNVDFGNNWEFIVQTYKFMSNEYRLFPVHFQLNACEVWAKNVFGIVSIKDHGNFTGCPIRKNIPFYFFNWTPDESLLPPLIPNGQYMVELQGLYHEDETGVVRIYGTILKTALSWMSVL